MAQVLLIYGLLLAPTNVLLGPLATSALLSRWFFQKRGAALGIAAAGISLGGLIFPPLIQLLIDTFEWREAFRILSGIILCLTTPAILLVVVNYPGERGLHPDGEGAAAQVAAEKAQGDRYASTGAVLRDPSFWLISLVMAALLCGNKGVLTNIVPLAIDLGTRADLAALLISMFPAGSLAGKILFAGLADRFDPRTVMAAGITGFGLGMSCLWRAELGYFMMATGGLCLGFATGGMLPLKGLLLARAFGPQNVGRVMGMMSMTIMPLNLVSPPLFGWIHDRTGL